MKEGGVLDVSGPALEIVAEQGGARGVDCLARVAPKLLVEPNPSY